MPTPLPIPREHGAWGLLLQPFLAGAILANRWDWQLVPAFGLVLTGFLLREPLTILARQQYVWRVRQPQCGPAARWLALEVAGATVCLGTLGTARPLAPLAALAATAMGMTFAAVWLTIANKQRSILLQLASAAGLSISAPLAILAATGRIPAWAWTLWAVLTLHGGVSILTVHARLALKRTGNRPRTIRYAVAAVPILAAAMAPALAAPLLFSGFANAWELRRLREPQAAQEPLRRVGLRTLAVSIVHSVFAIAALWPAVA